MPMRNGADANRDDAEGSWDAVLAAAQTAAGTLSVEVERAAPESFGHFLDVSFDARAQREAGHTIFDHANTYLFNASGQTASIPDDTAAILVVRKPNGSGGHPTAHLYIRPTTLL